MPNLQKKSRVTSNFFSLKSALLVTLIIMTVMMSFGCTVSKQPVELVIGVMSDEAAIPFIMAEAEGFYEKHGLKVQVEVFKSAADRDSMLQAEKLDAVMSDMLAQHMMTRQGFGVKSLFQTSGDYKLVFGSALTEHNSNPTIEDLKALGREISVGISANTVIEFVTDMAIESLGSDINVKKEVVPQMPVRLELLSTGKLDAATLPEPLATAVGVESGISALSLGYKPGIFLATAKSYSEKSEAFEKFEQAYAEAVEITNKYLDEGKTDYILEKVGEKLSFPGNLKEVGYTPLKFLGPQEADEHSFETIENWLLEKGLITN